MRETIPSAGKQSFDWERITTTQRSLLREMKIHGKCTPETSALTSAMRALLEKGYAEERVNSPGSYKITALGLERMLVKMGRPSKMVHTSLQPLIDYCEGMHKMSERIGVSPNTINRWALHGATPKGAGRKNLIELAEEAGCDISKILDKVGT